MRWLINYIRSCFCKHEWEQIFEVPTWSEDTDIDDQEDEYPLYYTKTYRCKKCGMEKQYRSF